MALSSDQIRQDHSVAALATGAPVDFSWLCEQVFTGGQTLMRPPYHMVLFASRRVPAVTAANVRAALGALRAASQYPALVGTLERAHISGRSTSTTRRRSARGRSPNERSAKSPVGAGHFRAA